MSVFHPKRSAHKGLKSLSSSSHSILNRLPSNGIPCFMCSDLSQRTPGKLSCLCAASDELCIHENIGNSGTPDHGGPSWCRDHIVHAPSQWEATLQCNVVSHWLGACTGWSLLMDDRLGKDRMARALQQLWKPWLTHWFLGGVVVLSNDFLTPMKDRYLEHFLWNFTQVNDTKAHWWLINIGSGNSLVSPWGDDSLKSVWSTLVELINVSMAYQEQFCYPRPVSAYGYWRCLICVCVCVSVHLYVNLELVRAIIHHPFELGSPNLD